MERALSMHTHLIRLLCCFAHWLGSLASTLLRRCPGLDHPAVDSLTVLYATPLCLKEIPSRFFFPLLTVLSFSLTLHLFFSPSLYFQLLLPSLRPSLTNPLLRTTHLDIPNARSLLVYTLGVSYRFTCLYSALDSAVFF